ncbi:MAG: methylated-DNA--[protein]-cysteine S-methyltransferase [Candidatus Lokiarchaeota archaeon]|nr:methylated-DNA--[protein]-cysteine S-methyltransferase [Candidatus Lokiarchaeota archaeon]MBD3201855.1 methylated-DNA--[protein]-cysteine S-methyltransferase [Candidatus Lokiarchaeota archaeon]
MPTEFTKKVLMLIKNIPKGKVSTYGRIAKLAGNPKAARQVSWILHSSSKKYNLPWHRVINSRGEISIKSVESKELQKRLLENEMIEINSEFKIDLNKYHWDLQSIEEINTNKKGR